MKKATFCILITLFISQALAAYDFSHHSDGHDLAETLVNEPQSIFVIFFYKTFGDEEKDKVTTDLRAQIRQKLIYQDVYYTEVDLSDDDKAAKYKEVTKMLGIDSTLLDKAPIVGMAFNRSGYWIHGDGVPKETAEIVQGFVKNQEKQAKKSGSAPVSFGGSSRHSSDRVVSVGGYN